VIRAMYQRVRIQENQFPTLSQWHKKASLQPPPASHARTGAPANLLG
jgi:hypothetical protein